ncbi:type 2 periplasmic-binding domain-containing protein [Alkalicoccobacillus gibsonii]|uniref:hypothetical protein n=1 Tax=Alkalicoccobacillus gibsonii TaxID=79881 RepID=UPI001932664C|nr:hypothetical protein [Alkalicoccobacillus gibsonii]MBM0065571.1 hypothetical protein [Alkalicoccobacillus gibsonii]
MQRLLGFLTLLTLLLTLSSCNTLEAEKTYESSNGSNPFEDQLITFLVPFQAGGGSDVFARFMTPHFTENISGNPRVQVENVPGGGSITGTNEYANSRSKNGLNLLTTSASSHIPSILEQSSVTYDLGEMVPIIGAPTGGVVYTSPDMIEDGLKEFSMKEGELFYAGMSPTGLDLVTLLSFEVLDLDVKAVLGYEGKGPARVAFEQGESNIDYQTTTAYKRNVQPLVENDEAVPLYSLGQIDESGNLIRDPQFPDLPTVEEIYIELHGKAPEGQSWEAYKHFVNASFTMQKILWVHKDAPEERVNTLIQSMESLVENESFKNQSEEILENYDPLIGEPLETQVQSMLEIEEETQKWILNFLMEEYEVDVNKL